MFFVVRRATLLIPSGPAEDPDRRHLFICLTDPAGAEQDTLLVSISSIVPGQPFDDTCRLYAGDHPFIRHDSYVSYRSLRVETAERLANGVANGVLIAREPMESGVFARICRGVEQSPFVAPKFLNYYLMRTQHG
jgi:hypothetical protein